MCPACASVVCQRVEIYLRIQTFCFASFYTNISVRLWLDFELISMSQARVSAQHCHLCLRCYRSYKWLLRWQPLLENARSVAEWPFCTLIFILFLLRKITVIFFIMYSCRDLVFQHIFDCPDRCLLLYAGKFWIKQMLTGAFMIPALVCGTAFFINFIAIYYHASRAIPFGTMVGFRDIIWHHGRVARYHLAPWQVCRIPLSNIVGLWITLEHHGRVVGYPLTQCHCCAILFAPLLGCAIPFGTMVRLQDRYQLYFLQIQQIQDSSQIIKNVKKIANLQFQYIIVFNILLLMLKCIYKYKKNRRL